MSEAEEKDIKKEEKKPSKGLDNWEEWKENNLEDWQKKRTEKDKEENEGCRNGCLFMIGVVVLLFILGFLTFTTEGCGLPFDIVVGGEFCLFASLGLSALGTLGKGLAIAVVFGLIGLVITIIGTVIVELRKNKKKEE